ncbi:hypothetical protein JN11_02860 [Mucilaginibacter frigoritolerans]|uniref:Capsule assembly protein Wzi n=1 Tax=Mucilaginibacter frigoritolerans TaxID=652788 RepID=A0A562TYJ9_9SPHI|nr:capsule assembly Wzi family protein [Mucilaginibacter frigoritolerans]TWI98672.1 hypothetical protein JN11_02860 [Mucilaginibacter frigoritolerans]
MKKTLILFFISYLFFVKCFAQTISVGDYAETLARMNQITGISDDVSSFCLRPVNSAFNSNGDSTLRYMAGSKNLVPGAKLFGAPVIIRLLPFSWLSDYNSKLPFGYNNGPMYPNVGYQTMATGGFYIKAGILRIQLKPELVYAQNSYFPTFPQVQGNIKSNLVGAFFNTVSFIDAPERFGNSSISHAYLGQSKITLVYKDVEAGISTENMWWGPGVQNSIMMSNSAPGFLHWTFNSANPIKTGIGSFEWQVIGGILKQSGFPGYDLTKFAYTGPVVYQPKPVTERYVSGFTANWQPKWIAGLYLGISGFDYLNKDSTWSSRSLLKRLFPVFVPSTRAANGSGQDFAYSTYVRQVLPQYHAELYFEYARNDQAAGLTDFFLEPEHSMAYTWGAARLFDLGNQQYIQTRVEVTHLEIPYTYLLRPAPTWYVHNAGAPKDGYTNEGRYIGAGIGPGSNSLIIDLSYVKKGNSFGVRFEKLEHDNDLFYLANEGVSKGLVPPAGSQWVDYSSTFYTNYRYKKTLFTVEYAPILARNYEYLTNNNIFNNHARIEITYFF